MGKNTGIRIEAVREISDAGDKGYRVTGIAALTPTELPSWYLQGDRPVVWQRCPTDNTKELLLKQQGNRTHTAYLGQRFYTIDEMTDRLSLIIEAGQHLADVKAELCEARAAWNGTATFVDGFRVDELDIDDAPEDQRSFDKPIELAEKIAKLWRENRLLHRDNAGHIKPIKPCE